jgi:hypothetical protein
MIIRVDTAPTPEINRIFHSWIESQAAMQKKMYGISVVITEMPARTSK